MASNTALVLAGLAALQSRDPQTITRIVADDCEWRPALTAGGDLERPVYHGPEGLIR